MVADPTDPETPSTTADTDAVVWVLVLQPLPSSVPVGVRVRMLLKRALRDWKLKCLSVGSGSRLPVPAETPRKRSRRVRAGTALRTRSAHPDGSEPG